ncbi:MAG: DUF2207 domain-containing protein, partial [Planctomycetes bacterium]|nr:DUF2207 domain-containing protein [Planctomycetota bacterium]
MRARTAVLVLCAIISAAARGAERERVLSFHSDIAIGADDSLTITETIRLVSTGNKIKRGILRDFPVRLWDGTRRKLYGFEVKGVLRGGQKEPYAVDRRARFGYARIKIGNENVLLPPGEHTYAITYRTTNHIRFFDDHDELYFNVNGTEWDFPIDKVSATITLPPGGKLYKDLINGFTGAAGEKGKDYKAKRLPDDRIFFETTRAFDVGENLTIVVPLDKGAVKQPPAPPEEKILHFDSDIELGADGVVQVRETIRLVVGGVKFDDGFTRDFPLVRRGLYERTTYRLAVQEVLRNGNKDLVLVNTDEVPDHARVSVGDYGAPPRDGEHTYTLRYTRAGHVRFGSHHDELVLDVTGAGWEVPIEKVCATVSLPQGAKLLADRVAGATGARGKDFTWRELPDGRVAFETTRPL